MKVFVLAVSTKSGSYSQMVEFKPLPGGNVQVTTTTRDEFPGGVPPWIRETLTLEEAREKYRWLVAGGYLAV